MRLLITIFIFTLSVFSLQGQINTSFTVGVGASLISEYSTEDRKDIDQYYINPSLGLTVNFEGGHQLEIIGNVHSNNEKTFIEPSLIIFLNTLPFIETENTQIGVLVGGGLKYNSWVDESDYCIAAKARIRFKSIEVFGRYQLGMLESIFYTSTPVISAGVNYSF